MSTIRCRFCHEYIDEAAYPDHEAEHLKLKADGQQSEYVTLPPEDRDPYPLEGVPKVYRHRKCGVATRMPDEIIRSYLKDPFLYSADATFCCGCGTHVPWSECVWVETGEDLQKYMDGLRAARKRGGTQTAVPAQQGKPEPGSRGCFGVILAICVGVGVLAARLLAG
jgi:hypothetical protein